MHGSSFAPGTRPRGFLIIDVTGERANGVLRWELWVGFAANTRTAGNEARGERVFKGFIVFAWDFADARRGGCFSLGFVLIRNLIVYWKRRRCEYCQ